MLWEASCEWKGAGRNQGLFMNHVPWHGLVLQLIGATRHHTDQAQ
jgi:hypothetical protein